MSNTEYPISNGVNRLSRLASNESRLTLFTAGFLISFVGSLPPGTTNIVMIEMAGAGNIGMAISLALGCFVAELLCVKLCLMIIHGAFKFLFLERIIQWLSLALLVLLSIASFIASSNDYVPDLNILLPDDQSPFIIGFVMMIFNPVQIPFWLGWTLVVMERRSSTFLFGDQVLYLTGIGVGSLLASGLFIFIGDILSPFFIEHRRAIHFILGCTFGVLVAMQVRRMSGAKKVVG